MSVPLSLRELKYFLACDIFVYTGDIPEFAVMVALAYRVEVFILAALFRVVAVAC